MALSTYSELQAAVKDWLAEDTLLDAVLPDMIQIVEVEMNYGRAARPGREPIDGFRTLDMQERSLIFLVEGLQKYNLPTDFLELIVLFDGAGESTVVRSPLNALTQRTMSQMAEDPNVSGLRYYGFSEGVLVIQGSPGADPGELTLLYYAKIPALSDANPTNWVLEKHPDLYLYGTLMHAAIYLKQDPARWEMMYEQAREGVIRADNAAQSGPVAQVSMPYRVA